MSAVAEAYRAPPSDAVRGRLAAAWRRLQAGSRRHGRRSASWSASCVMILASAFGLVAGDWSKEVGVPDAPPGFPRARGRTSRPADPIASAMPTRREAGRPLATSIRSRRSYKEWAERAAKIADHRVARAPRRCRSAATGWGRDVLRRSIKGSEVSIFVGVFAALLATLIGTMLGAVAGYCRRPGQRLPRVGLQRLHLDPGHPADLRVRGGARAAASAR